MPVSRPSTLVAAAALLSCAARSPVQEVRADAERRLLFGYYDGVTGDTISYSNLNLANTIPEAKKYAEEMQQRPNGGGVTLLNLHDVGLWDWTTRKIVEDPQSWWDKWVSENEIAALVRNGTIHGLNLGDELVWHCISPRNVTLAADMIRKTFPRVGSTGGATSPILWANEAALLHAEGATHVENNCRREKFATIPAGSLHNAASPDAFRIPKALDWFSVDLYHMDGQQKGWVEGDFSDPASRSPRAYYERWIFPNLTQADASQTGQKALLVPGSFGSDVNHWQNGTYVCDRGCYDRMCSYDASDFYDWALADDRVAAIAPWNWRGCPSCNGSQRAGIKNAHGNFCCMDEIGTKDMPLARATWEQIGRQIIGKPGAPRTSSASAADVEPLFA